MAPTDQDETNADRLKAGARRKKPIPSPDSIVEEATFVSPKGKVYRVIRTTQADPYDPPLGQPRKKQASRKKSAPRKKRRPQG